MKPWRVLFVSHSSGMAGAERALLTLTQRLDPERFQPTVAVPGPGPLADRLKEAGVAVVIGPSVRWWLAYRRDYGLFALRWFHARMQADVLRRLVRPIRPQVVVTNTISIPHGAMIARDLHIPHLWYIHEFLVDGGLQPPLPRAAFFALLAALSDRSVAVSEAVRRQFPAGARRKVAVVYNGIDQDGMGSAERSDPGEAAGLRLIQVGTILREKGQLEAVQALEIVRRRYPGTRLTLVGSENAKVGATLRAYIAERGLGDAVKLTGYVDDASRCLAEADVCLIPSWTEAFSLTALEALRAGVPVIAADVGGNAESLARGGGILVAPRSPEALAAAILRLQENPDLRHRLAAEGMAAAQHFTLDEMVQGFEGELQRVLDKHYRPLRWRLGSEG